MDLARAGARETTGARVSERDEIALVAVHSLPELPFQPQQQYVRTCRRFGYEACPEEHSPNLSGGKSCQSFGGAPGAPVPDSQRVKVCLAIEPRSVIIGFSYFIIATRRPPH